MTKYKRKWLVLMLCGILVLSGCQSEAQEPPKDEEPTGEGEPVIVNQEPVKEDPALIWYSTENIADVDPVYQLTQTSESFLNNLYEGLFREKNGQIHMAMAESETLSEDGLTVTFKIREAYWSDGEAVTAGQFVYGWNRMIMSESPYAYYFDQAKIVSFNAPDDQTLIVTLSEPNSFLNEYLTFGVFIPQREGLLMTLTPSLVGNGPYEVISNDDGILSLCKSDTYWEKDLITLEAIDYVGGFNGDGLHDLVVNDGLDVLDTIGDEMVAQFSENALFHSTRDAIYYFVLNPNATPFDDPLYREMIQKGINRDTLANELYGKQIPAYHMYPERYVSEEAQVDTFDQLMDAKLILEDRGFPEGLAFEKIRLLTLDSQGHVDVANSLKVQLKKNLGIDLEIDAVPWEEYQEKRIAGEYDMVRVAWQGQLNYPGVFLDPINESDALSFIPFSDEGFDKFLMQAKTATDALEYYHVADDTLMASDIVVPLFYYTDPFYMSQRFEAVYKTHRGILYFGSTQLK